MPKIVAGKTENVSVKTGLKICKTVCSARNMFPKKVLLDRSLFTFFNN